MHATVTLQDVADLAKVRRPVVSMWRKRPMVRGVSHPFPAVVQVVDGRERFDLEAVVDWLRDTGRGNNREAADDAPAMAIPDAVSLDTVITLLAWHVMTGDDLGATTLEQRARRAAEFDPDDEVLLREAGSLDVADVVLDYVDNLAAASFGAPDALARAESGRLKRAEAARDLAPQALDLLRALVHACVVHLGTDDLTFGVDGGALSLDIAAHEGLVIASQDRGLLRRALIRGLRFDAAGRVPDVAFTSVIGLAPIDVLDALDEVVLQLPAGKIALVIGSAAILTDTLAGPLQSRRAEVLRVENLVAALRLPRGWWREAHRQSLAVWVCVGGARNRRPLVGDLGAADAVVPADVAADVVAALSGGARGFRYARRVDVTPVLAGGALVPRGIRPATLRMAVERDELEAVHAASLVTSASLRTLDVLVQPSPGRLQLAQRSLGQLRDEGKLALMRGTRIDATHADPNGTVPVLPPGESGPVLFDPFDADKRYPRAVRTEPGDVIFVEAPRPHAWVDVRGGSMVASPARILRLAANADVGPRLLAATINRLPDERSEWQTWAVPATTGDEGQRLETALADIAEFQETARQKLTAAGDLAAALIGGVAAGSLSLDAAPTTVGESAPQKGQ